MMTITPLLLSSGCTRRAPHDLSRAALVVHALDVHAVTGAVGEGDDAQRGVHLGDLLQPLVARAAGLQRVHVAAPRTEREEREARRKQREAQQVCCLRICILTGG